MFKRALLPIAAALMLACSPTYNWREVRNSSASFTVLMPAKPSTHSRQIDLDGMKVEMTMTAAEAGGATFAVGAVALKDEASARVAADKMKTAMLRNINGAVTKEKSAVDGAAVLTEIEASGAGTTGSRLWMAGRFVAKGRRAYQAIALAPKPVPAEALEMFMSSFKPEQAGDDGK